MNSFIISLRKGLALTALALSALFITSVFTPALAETTACTAITSLPRTITTQGIYCLTGDMSTSMTSGEAITINTNNVTIDLNGYKLGGLGAGAGTLAKGIYASQRKNITIRNGSVRGFYYGIYLYDSSPYTTSSGHIVEDIRADGNTFMGMLISGTGNIIRNNQVVNTGGSTYAGAFGDAFGIYAAGPGSSVINNDIINTVEQSGGSFSTGVTAYSCNGCAIENNRISNSSAGPSASAGVDIGSSTNVMVVNNRVSTLTYGIRYSSATGKYRDNLTSGVTTPYSGSGTAIGTTNN